jgi:hypothetical protein
MRTDVIGSLIGLYHTGQDMTSCDTQEEVPIILARRFPICLEERKGYSREGLVSSYLDPTQDVKLSQEEVCATLVQLMRSYCFWPRI